MELFFRQQSIEREILFRQIFQSSKMKYFLFNVFIRLSSPMSNKSIIVSFFLGRNQAKSSLVFSAHFYYRLFCPMWERIERTRHKPVKFPSEYSFIINTSSVEEIHSFVVWNRCVIKEYFSLFSIFYDSYFFVCVAMANNKTQCASCGKNKATSNCIGCSQNFCSKHFTNIDNN